MTDSTQIIVIELQYTSDDLSKVDALIDAHMAFIDAQYKAGIFLASGPKVPRTGGVILAKGTDIDTIAELMNQDPFLMEGVATYSYTAFLPRRTDAEAFADL
ncbi:MAG: YciI family protein [Hyphomicrobiales bacterium]